MKIAFKDFRAFQETRLINVRPLTFLVGENSSGKTSFLAALNYMWRLNERLVSPSFNSPPFDLGAFDEIVHRVRGRAKPEFFEIIAEETVTIDPRQSAFYLRRFPVKNRLTDTARLRIRFSDNVGDAVISKFLLSFAGYELSVKAEHGLRIEITTNKGKALFDSQDGQELLEFEERLGRIENLSVDEVSYLMRRLLIEHEGEDDTAVEAQTALATTGAALDIFLRSFPASIFASAPVRSNPIRVYTPSDQNRTPEGSHTPQRLFKIKESNQAQWERIKSRLEAFGKMSGMFSAINVARYRSSGSSPFNINVTRKGKQSNIVDVGYGVSQALPILTDLIESPPGCSPSAFVRQIEVIG